MKKLIIYSLLIFSFFNLYSQGKEIVLGSKNSSPEYLAGSLPVNFSGNFHKLKIEIFGGNYHNGNLGENHYYISTRDGLKINQEIHGGSYEKYTLKVYDNGNGYDFVIKVMGDWPSFLVRSWTIDSSKNPQENTITDYNPKGKTDITNTVKVNTIFATNNDGNIGIGTNAPKTKIHVDGKGGEPSANVQDLENKANFILSSAAHSPNGLGTNTRLYAGIGTYKYAWLQAHNGHNGGSVQSIALNPSGGSVSIGTTDSKGYKLAIAGKAIAEEVTIQLQSTWPDFVFDKNYTLPTLQEVEEHINQKGHLANIPSAKEVKEKGIEVGEMHKKFLQKIEELTLYTIQQQKELDTAKEKNNTLEKRLSRLEKIIDKIE